MLVLQSTYDRLRMQLIEVRVELALLTVEWNKLVKKINKKGGEDFLEQKQVLSKEEIKTLISLCHPDKHNGKKSAVEITQRLLELRN